MTGFAAYVDSIAGLAHFAKTLSIIKAGTMAFNASVIVVSAGLLQGFPSLAVGRF
jgi:hypothetical protein